MEQDSKQSNQLVDVYRKAVEARISEKVNSEAEESAAENDSVESNPIDDKKDSDRSKKDKKDRKDSSKKKSKKKNKDERKDKKNSSGKSKKKSENEKPVSDKHFDDAAVIPNREESAILRSKSRMQNAKFSNRISKADIRSSSQETQLDSKKASMKFEKNSAKATQAIITSTQAQQQRDRAEKEARQKKEQEKRQSALEEFKTLYPYMQNRELSWLEFNKRVLDQGADPTVPLFERLNFISIFWSNLQEFFMVRVGSLTDLSLLKKALIDSKSGMTPSEQLKAIYDRCHELYPYYEDCFKTLKKLLNNEGIRNLGEKDITEDQRDYLDDYFTLNVMPFLSPQIVNARHPFPHLENGALYIVVRLNEEAEGSKNSKGDSSKDSSGKKKKDAKNMGAEGVTLGIIPLPRQCERIIEIPNSNGSLEFMLLEHLIEMCVPRIFSMYKVKHTNIICVTRNADLDANEGMDEQGEDYREHMKRILKKRARLAPVRLESERELSANVKPLLMDRLNLKPHQVFTSSVPLDMSYVFSLPSRVSEEKRAALTATPFTPQWPASLDRNRRIMDQVSEREILLSYPYESMDAFVQLLREASADPSVVSIKITLYRLAQQSHLAEALIAAAERGKEVTALFELRARFDEFNNIEWSQRFEEAGCNVIYGFKNYKVHSKICCITRQTESGLQHITQLGTGNYNEKTAKLYTDLSFITTDHTIGQDAMKFFRNMALENTSDDYETLWVAPLQIKQNVIAGIDEQIRRHENGLPSGLFFKTNSITDKEVIDKIVEASQAGVPCKLFVRGISCIVPGVEGYTENVSVDSIVGRLLEHSRIFCFGPLDGDVDIYLSSADLMTRNMDKRIEIAWPIKAKNLRDEIIGYIATCLADTAKLRELLPSKEYTPLGFFAEQAGLNGVVELFDSQSFLIDEAIRKQMDGIEEEVAPFAYNIAAVRDIEQGEIEAEMLTERIGTNDMSPENAAYAATVDTEIGEAAISDAEVASEVIDEIPENMPNNGDYYQPIDGENVGVLEDTQVQPDSQIQEPTPVCSMPLENDPYGYQSSPDDLYTDEAIETLSTEEIQEVPLENIAELDIYSSLEPIANTAEAEQDNIDSYPVSADPAAQPNMQMPMDDQTEQNAFQEAGNLPMIEGAGKYTVIPDDQATEDTERLTLPNLERQDAMRIAIERSEYTDPETSPQPLEIPKEKKSFFKRIFGD